MIRAVKLFSAIAATFLLACSHSASEDSLLFEGAWVRAMPPGSMMTAGFGQLINSSAADIKIVGYSSPQFASVTLHQSLLEAGVSRMEEVPALSMPAGSEIELAPGGYHLMFMRPVGKLPDEVLLHIDLPDDRRFSFTLPIERR